MYVKNNFIAVFDHNGHDGISRGQVQDDGLHVLLTAPFPELGVEPCRCIDSSSFLSFSLFLQISFLKGGQEQVQLSVESFDLGSVKVSVSSEPFEKFDSLRTPRNIFHNTKLQKSTFKQASLVSAILLWFVQGFCFV